jgi:glucose dehydrogenase
MALLPRHNNCRNGIISLRSNSGCWSHGRFLPYIRAFDIDTGNEIWKAQLPASGNATPMTYQMNGKQYLVIAAGGHQRIPEESLGDAIVAFALP